MMSLGFAIFLVIGLMAMWVLMFLATFLIPYWITLSVFDMFKPKKFEEETVEE